VENRAGRTVSRCLSMCRNALAGLALAATGAAMAPAAEWPTRTVTVVVPYAAGGNTDIMARMATQKLSEAFGQGFIVDNRVGAGGALAAAYVAQAAPDGYTLLFAASPVIAVLPKIQKVNFDPHKDFLPVSVFGTGPSYSRSRA
jgi:tripartite-type tricarboxylate transporter receptor subunit TctC